MNFHCIQGNVLGIFKDKQRKIVVPVFEKHGEKKEGGGEGEGKVGTVIPIKIQNKSDNSDLKKNRKSLHYCGLEDREMITKKSVLEH